MGSLFRNFITNDAAVRVSKTSHMTLPKSLSKGSSGKATHGTRIVAMVATMGAATIFAGCQSPAPAPARINVPRDPSQGAVTSYEPLRPLRDSSQDQGGVPQPLYEDVPLITQAPPEQQAFVRAYEAVGKPRIVVFVNRTVEGQIIPVAQPRTLVGVDVRQESSAAVDIERRQTSESTGRFQDRVDEKFDSFKSEGPATFRETREVYLAAGQYDEVAASRIDYDAIETVLSDWFSAGGKVTLISADMARQRLTEEQVKELEAGRPTALRELAERLDADILIQAQAKVTRQTKDGLEIRMLVEAINTPRQREGQAQVQGQAQPQLGGESLARAFVDVPPPLEKTQINKYTRFLARKIMSQLSASWDPANR